MMTIARCLRLGLFLILAAATLAVAAQDAKKDAANQQAAAIAKLKKAEFSNTVVVESKHFVVACLLAEEKAKALGTALDKVVPVARKALQVEEKEELWKGKLAVYVLPDSAAFKSFMRSVVVAQPEGVHYDLRSDNPFVVDPVEVPAKSTESDQFFAVSATIAGAMLRAKGSGAAMPDWLAAGFGRVTAMRAEGLNSRRYQAYKTAARTQANRGAKPTDLWGESRPPSADVLAASFAEYLAYGPGAANFARLITGFRPDESGNPASPQAAFEAAGWKDLAMLEAAWRKWAVRGK